MRAEREIVDRWLSSQGFFTISNLNAGSNREVDVIAIRHQAGKVERVWHVEIDASLAAPIVSTRERGDIQKRFEDAGVQSAVRRAIFDHLGSDHPYEKVLITSHASYALPGVITFALDEIIVEVLASIDRHRYGSETIRTIQLIKHLVLSRRRPLRRLFARMDATRKRRLAADLVTSEEGLAFLRTKAGEPLLLAALEGSSLAASEDFGRRLVRHLLTKRARAAMLREVFPPAEEARDGNLEQFIS